MNNFAHIKPIAAYRKVVYYSVSIGNAPASLFEEFVDFHTQNNKNKLDHFLNWIRIIGNQYGAQLHYFRPEAAFADTSALPPKGKDRKPNYVEHGKNKANTLRLYCLRANEHVVFLFSGDIKTTQKAQDCPNVSNHFRLANQLTKAIDFAFQEGDIKWNENCTNIIYKEDFKITY